MIICNMEGGDQSQVEATNAELKSIYDAIVTAAKGAFKSKNVEKIKGLEDSIVDFEGEESETLSIEDPETGSSGKVCGVSVLKIDHSIFRQGITIPSDSSEDQYNAAIMNIFVNPIINKCIEKFEELKNDKYKLYAKTDGIAFNGVTKLMILCNDTSVESFGFFAVGDSKLVTSTEGVPYKVRTEGFLSPKYDLGESLDPRKIRPNPDTFKLSGKTGKLIMGDTRPAIYIAGQFGTIVSEDCISNLKSINSKAKLYNSPSWTFATRDDFDTIVKQGVSSKFVPVDIFGKWIDKVTNAPLVESVMYNFISWVYGILVICETVSIRPMNTKDTEMFPTQITNVFAIFKNPSHPGKYLTPLLASTMEYFRVNIGSNLTSGLKLNDNSMLSSKSNIKISNTGSINKLSETALKSKYKKDISTSNLIPTTESVNVESSDFENTLHTSKDLSKIQKALRVMLNYEGIDVSNIMLPKVDKFSGDSAVLMKFTPKMENKSMWDRNLNPKLDEYSLKVIRENLNIITSKCSDDVSRLGIISSDTDYSIIADIKK